MVNDRKIRTEDYLYLESHFDTLDKLSFTSNELAKEINNNEETRDLFIHLDYNIIKKKDNQKDYVLMIKAFKKHLMN